MINEKRHRKIISNHKRQKTNIKKLWFTIHKSNLKNIYHFGLTITVLCLYHDIIENIFKISL